MATYQRQQIPTCFASCSIGHNKDHNLPAKLEAISVAGFSAIELSMPDILSYGKEITGNDIDGRDYEKLQEIGSEIKDLCQHHDLKILMLQPFPNFEGWTDAAKRGDAFERARGWLGIMRSVGTDMLQIGSSDAPGISSSFDDMAKDLGELADIFAEQGCRIAYENWCWATHAPNWKEVWEVVKRANRPNLGLCLDTFQSAGGEWADPRTESGLIEGVAREQLKARWKQSCKDLAATIPSDKIFLLQISDAYKMSPPIKDEVDDSGTRPRGQWSSAHRPLPYDGGYLPVVDFIRAVLDTGFRSWFSMEVFDGQGPEKYDAMGPFAEKSMKALARLLDEADNV